MCDRRKEDTINTESNKVYQKRAGADDNNSVVGDDSHDHNQTAICRLKEQFHSMTQKQNVRQDTYLDFVHGRTDERGIYMTATSTLHLMYRLKHSFRFRHTLRPDRVRAVQIGQS